MHDKIPVKMGLLVHCLRCSFLQSTVLTEVWTRLYQLAHEASNDEDSDPAVVCLNKRILSSLQPDKTMVFVLDLLKSGRSPTQHVVPSHRGSHVAGVQYAF